MKYEHHPEIIVNINHWNMEIIDSGYVFLDHDNWRSTSVCSPYSRLYLISRGQGYLDISNERMLLLPGHAYLVPAGLTFDYGCEDHLEKLFFHLRLVKPDGYDLAHGLSFVSKCPLEKNFLSDMLARFRGTLWEDVLLLDQDIRSITLRLLRQYDVLHKSPTSYSSLVKEAMQYIHSHLSAGLTTRKIADALFVSDITLTRRFQRETGRTIHQYLEDMVFQAACKRLAGSEQSLREISEELGFCDPFYFSRRFRQHFGEPPSQYRKRLKSY
ncbi:MAG: helix-turn-helix transcriptional regulator [Lachnospiraceae bacterium]|nr:helix-turn-helix transcriptional regulator [Lachnospiraceae bacterium]